MKKLYTFFLVMLLGAMGSWGQPANPLDPLQGGENIAAAFILSGPLPIISSGTTEGHLDDYDEVCPNTGSTAPDVVYAYTPPSNVIVDIDLCGSSFDTKVFVYENAYTPGVPFACDDDYYDGDPCGAFVSKIEGAVLTGGNTYYIIIDGYSSEDYGDYILTISETITCIWGVNVLCPPYATPESEACGDDSNGGCDMPVGTESWEPVPSAGGTICGTTRANEGSRDTDWFELVLTETSMVVLTVDADQLIEYGLMDGGTGGYGGNPDCSTLTGILPVNTAGPCDETFLDLGTLNPGTYWFIVRMTVDEGFPCDNHYWIKFEVAPLACATPVELFAGNITTTAADLGWTETGTATAWEYQIGPAGFTPAATGTPTTVDPTPIAGLSANTSYDFYVRADCGGGLYSNWSGPETFKTPCNPIAAIPWSENFDTMTTIGNNILSGCWAAESFTGTPWSSGNAASNSYNDPCSAPNYLFVYYSPYPADKFLITPGFTLNAAISYDLRFNWIGDGYAGWTGDILVNTAQTGTGASVLGAPFVIAGTTTTTACTLAKRSFVPPATGTYYFMVRVSNTISPYYLGFDDFVLELSPSCPEPAVLTANNITQNSANLSWALVGPEASWEYAYGVSPLPFPAGPGTATSSNTVNLVSGLFSNTVYQYYVRSYCGPGFSTWAGPYTFITLCDAITSLPWTEGFEAGWPPACWMDAETAEYGWDQSTFGAAHSGSEWAYCNLAGSQLVTPAFNLSADSRLAFRYRAEDVAFPQDMTVKIGNDVIYQINADSSKVYEEVHVSLAAYTGQTISVTFTGETGTGGVDFGICLDDVTVDLINNWTGNISTAWNNLGNWSLGNVPDQYDAVFIPSFPVGGNFPEIDSGIIAECNDIILAPGATIKVKPGGTLNVKNP